jgi:hypothetical protein
MVASRVDASEEVDKEISCCLPSRGRVVVSFFWPLDKPFWRPCVVLASTYD